MSDKSIVPFSDPSGKPQSFSFNGNSFNPFIGEDGEPRFVASEVCRALAITDVKQAIERLDDDEKGKYSVLTGGGIQVAWCVNEAGLYNLILGSRKTEAREFKRWITHEVLPALHRTGQYSLQKMTPLQQLQAFVASLTQHQEKIEEHDTRILSLEGRVGKPEFYTILGYCRLRRLPPPTEPQARAMGKKAALLSRERGMEIGDADDARYATVHTYHLSILDELFGGSHDR